MGKVISLINTTPDGFADGKYAIINAEFYEFTHGLLAKTGTVAFGRNTFELFQERWMAVLKDETMEGWQVRMARALNDKPKIVYSSTLKTTKWENSSIVEQVDATQINTYKTADQLELLTLGSLKLVESLTQMNLIDDYYFCIQPLIAGDGNVRLFGKQKTNISRPLKYVDSIQLKSGVHIIHYTKK
jgi:dihydrofolate reductase